LMVSGDSIAPGSCVSDRFWLPASNGGALLAGGLALTSQPLTDLQPSPATLWPCYLQSLAAVWECWTHCRCRPQECPPQGQPGHQMYLLLLLTAEVPGQHQRQLLWLPAQQNISTQLPYSCAMAERRPCDCCSCCGGTCVNKGHIAVSQPGCQVATSITDIRSTSAAGLSCSSLQCKQMEALICKHTANCVSSV
jgi:hypothetical protein